MTRDKTDFKPQQTDNIQKWLRQIPPNSLNYKEKKPSKLGFHPRPWGRVDETPLVITFMF